MRDYLLPFLLLILIFIASAAYGWHIENYHVEIKVEEKGDLTIVERLTVNFGHTPKHGIYRNIPLKFKNPSGERKTIKISEIYVFNDKFETLKTKVFYSSDQIKLVIGEPDKLVAGIQDYIITYKVRYALYSLGKIDELYWNAIGTAWDVPIKRASAKVQLPFDHDSIQYTCYVGVLASRNRGCIASKKGKEIFFNLTRELSPREGLTVAVGWQHGLISLRTGPPWWQNTWFFPLLYIPLLIVVFYFYWRAKGRDVEGKRVLQVQYYPPAGITPIEAGCLFDERVDSRDLIAEIIDLARRGYIKIVEITMSEGTNIKEKDYLFQRLRDYKNEPQLNRIDREILDNLFKGGSTCRLSQLKNSFYRAVPNIDKLVYTVLTSEGYFFKNPHSIRSMYNIIGFFVFAISFFAAAALIGRFPMEPLPFILSGAVTGIGIIVLGRFMPRKTKRGTELKEQLLGYREFIRRVERNVIEKLYPSDKIPLIFEITLPYALIFGEEKRWVSAFADLFPEPPGWYGGTDAFTPLSFNNSMNDFVTTASEILSSTAGDSEGSASGGGGSSGGGGGGGGGGAW